jgi:hypothetical protein
LCDSEQRGVVAHRFGGERVDALRERDVLR